jgi:hypothetical protein
MRPALLVATFALVGCASASRPPHDRIAARFRYKVDFERGKREATATDRVDVLELWGTRPSIEIGGEYVVVGRYTLESEEQGRVFFYMTGNNWDNSGPVMDLQRADARRGTGTFVLQHKMAGPGWFHVSLHGGNRKVADLYFGEGETLLAAVDPAGAGGPAR